MSCNYKWFNNSYLTLQLDSALFLYSVSLCCFSSVVKLSNTGNPHLNVVSLYCWQILVTKDSINIVQACTKSFHWQTGGIFNGHYLWFLVNSYGKDLSILPCFQECKRTLNEDLLLALHKQLTVNSHKICQLYTEFCNKLFTSPWLLLFIAILILFLVQCILLLWQQI